MTRILMMLMIAVAGEGVVVLEANAAEGKAEICCAECKDCEKTCLVCADACLSELAAGKADRKNCIKLCQDCADICGTCSRIAARGGPLEGTIAAACAAACEKCAAECGKHKDDKVCQACAEQCLKCAKECKVKSTKN